MAFMPAQALTYTFQNATFPTPVGQISGSFDYTPTSGVTNFSSITVSAWIQGTQAQSATYDANAQRLEFSRVGSSQNDRQFFRISGLALTNPTVSLNGLPTQLVRCTRSNCEGRPPRTQSFNVTFSGNAELTAVPAGSAAAGLLPLAALLARGRSRYTAKA